MKVTHNASILFPQEAGKAQVQSHLDAFMQQIERVINSIFTSFHANAASVKNPATQSLSDQITALASDESQPVAQQLVERLQNTFFDRLDSVATLESETQQQKKNPSEEALKASLKYLNEEKLLLRKARLQLTENFSCQQEELNNTDSDLRQQRAVLEEQLSKLTRDSCDTKEKLQKVDSNLSQYSGITGRIKQLFFFWRVWRDKATRRELHAEQKKYAEQNQMLGKQLNALNDKEIRSNLQEHQSEAEKKYLAQCLVLDKAQKKLDARAVLLRQQLCQAAAGRYVKDYYADQVVENDAQAALSQQSVPLQNSEAQHIAVQLRKKLTEQEVLHSAVEPARSSASPAKDKKRDSGIFEADALPGGNSADMEADKLFAGMRSRRDSGFSEQGETLQGMVTTSDTIYLEESDNDSIADDDFVLELERVFFEKLVLLPTEVHEQYSRAFQDYVAVDTTQVGKEENEVKMDEGYETKWHELRSDSDAIKLNVRMQQKYYKLAAFGNGKTSLYKIVEPELEWDSPELENPEGSK